MVHRPPALLSPHLFLAFAPSTRHLCRRALGGVSGTITFSPEWTGLYARAIELLMFGIGALSPLRLRVGVFGAEHLRSGSLAL